MDGKQITTRYYDMEEASVKGFCAFVKSNIPLVIAVTFTLFFSFGSKLFWYATESDAEWFLSDRSFFYIINSQRGRFGWTILSMILFFNGFNPFTAFFITFCSIWIYTISWCYIISIFSRNTGRNDKLIPLALIFMTAPVWAELFIFLGLAAETALIIGLCPYVIYLFYKGFLDNERGKVITASLLLLFMTSVYQAIIPLFCCGVFIIFVLLQENSDYEPQVYRKLCLKLFATLLIILAVHTVISRLFVFALYGNERDEYLDTTINQWGQVPIKQVIMEILGTGYVITIGQIPLVQRIFNPIIASYTGAGMLTAEEYINIYASVSRVHGNILLLPITALFLARIIARQSPPPTGRRLLYILAGIGIPLSIMLLAIVIGNRPAARTLWALPLATAFMFYYLIMAYKKKAATVIACLALFTAFYQAQMTAQLFYSFQMQYNKNVSLSQENNNLITQVQPDEEKLPVVFIGSYNIASQFSMNPNFPQSNAIGLSAFERGCVHAEQTVIHRSVNTPWPKTRI
ncbi:MAG: glucosyltransferase domain-containing protein [Treponema sp.]|nr:glucosyltransferase domain-containing protein [Treponema sp.]